MIFEKLQQARDLIKKSDLKKKGKNYNFEYYTPEQVNQLVYEAEGKVKLFHKFDLVRSENDLHGVLTIVDLENGDNTTFTQATELPAIPKANSTQQLGGAVTYTNRYLLMTAYDIVDNNLDFDSHDNKSEPAKQDDKKWLNPGTTAWATALSWLKQDGNTIAMIQKKYKISKENIEKLKDEVL